MEWYYLYSSVAGQKINDIYDGLYAGSLVHLGDTVIHDDTYKGPYWGSTDPPQQHSWGFTTTDPVTGSTQEILPDGTVAARNELAGLGTSIPSQEPQSQTSYLPNYHLGGYAGDAGNGCQWNGAPWPCDLMGTASRGANSVSYEVNIRAEGGWSLFTSLEAQVVTVKGKVRQVLDNEDPRLTKELYKDFYRLKDLGRSKVGLLVGSFYASFLSSAAESIFSRLSNGVGSAQTYPILTSAIDRVKTRIRERPACADFLSNIDAEHILDKRTTVASGTSKGSFKSEVEAARATNDVDAKGNPIAGGSIVFNVNGFAVTGIINGAPAAGVFSAKVRQLNGLGDLSFDELLEQVIIHELKHLDDAKGLWKDGGGPNRSLNLAVLDACFKPIQLDGAQQYFRSRQGGYGLF